MDNEILALAAAFEPADKADWLTLVEKTLKGASIESLRGMTADGGTVEPLYTRSPARQLQSGPALRRAGVGYSGGRGPPPAGARQ